VTFELERLEWCRAHGELRLVDERRQVLGSCPAPFVSAGVMPGHYHFEVKRTGTGWRIEGVRHGRCLGELAVPPSAVRRAYIAGDTVTLEVP
jgi:hypothetical protein